MANPQYKKELDGPVEVPRNLSDTLLRKWLIAKLEEIDATKRNITKQMSDFHDAEKAGLRGRDYYAWQARAKAKKSHLTEERARLRMLLGDVNQRIKKSRITKNSKTRPDLQLAQCFMMAAEDILEPDMFRELENKAMRILEV